MHTLESIKALASTSTVAIRGGGVTGMGARGKQARGVELAIGGGVVLCLYVPSASGDAQYDQYTWYVGGDGGVIRDEQFIQRLIDRERPAQYAADAPWRQVKGGIIR